ncbi:MAG: DsrE family protein [Hyphomicrobiaceae bacterium]
MTKATILAIAAVLAFAAAPAMAKTKAPKHKVAVQVNENDPKVMNLALNNVQNIFAYYKKKGETVSVEIVTYGPGLNMLREDTSPVKARISELSIAQPTLKFDACANTHSKMELKEKKKIKLLSEAAIVPSGVIKLMELQEKGYTYLRP